MEEYLLGIEKNPVIDNKEIAEFWDGLPANLSKLENVIWAKIQQMLMTMLGLKALMVYLVYGTQVL